jgi:hypothetical protein
LGSFVAILGALAQGRDTIRVKKMSPVPFLRVLCGGFPFITTKSKKNTQEKKRDSSSDGIQRIARIDDVQCEIKSGTLVL